MPCRRPTSRLPRRVERGHAFPRSRSRRRIWERGFLPRFSETRSSSTARLRLLCVQRTSEADLNKRRVASSIPLKARDCKSAGPGEETGRFQVSIWAKQTIARADYAPSARTYRTRASREALVNGVARNFLSGVSTAGLNGRVRDRIGSGSCRAWP